MVSVKKLIFSAVYVILFSKALSTYVLSIFEKDFVLFLVPNICTYRITLYIFPELAYLAITLFNQLF